MKNSDDVYAIYFFLAAAVFNWVVTFAWFFAYPSVFPLLSMPVPEDPMFMQLFSALAFVFGIGYYFVSRAPAKGGDIVAMGIVGKLMVFLIVAYYWYFATASVLLFFIACGDAVFAMLMLIYLSRQRRELAR